MATSSAQRLNRSMKFQLHLSGKCFERESRVPVRAITAANTARNHAGHYCRATRTTGTQKTTRS